MRPQRSAASRMRCASACSVGLAVALLLEQAGAAHHDGQRVVQLVRHAGQQAAHRGELLALAQRLALALDLLRGGAALGQVGHRGGEVRSRRRPRCATAPSRPGTRCRRRASRVISTRRPSMRASPPSRMRVQAGLVAGAVALRHDHLADRPARAPSSRRRPNIASAAGLNSTMRPCASVEMIAASAWSTIADFSARACCSRACASRAAPKVSPRQPDPRGPDLRQRRLGGMGIEGLAVQVVDQAQRRQRMASPQQRRDAEEEQQQRDASGRIRPHVAQHELAHVGAVAGVHRAPGCDGGGPRRQQQRAGAQRHRRGERRAPGRPAQAPAARRPVTSRPARRAPCSPRRPPLPGRAPRSGRCRHRRAPRPARHAGSSPVTVPGLSFEHQGRGGADGTVRLDLPVHRVAEHLARLAAPRRGARPAAARRRPRRSRAARRAVRRCAPRGRPTTACPGRRRSRCAETRCARR